MSTHDGQQGLFCPDQSRCWWCGAPALVLCDAVIGLDIEDTDKIHTCDAALCAEHRKQFGNVSARGRGGYHDTLDHCPEHAGTGFLGVQRRIDDDQADALRRRMYQRAPGQTPNEDTDRADDEVGID